ncbi:pleckstrin homology domain-containing family J member 1-like [Diabrotica virgifera virgifera]|uniref:Pleckstrin homology domain-containing family J member 1 n=3 Tax=Diabrotica virgifera virgifera TaxID=50390 RepID=A0ABM5LA37_DIAVI|nr:pleckstrin homology domain-containing family J member 1-like [Diabrotica virgifera virgifera]
MKYNDRELITFGETKADLEGVLHHMKPQGNDWLDWYQRPHFKERYFKLTSNILFYYKVGEEEPIGILILENAQVSYERPHKGIPFAFSITFKVNDRLKDEDAKHIFSCRCDTDVSKWVSALKMASYEYWRSQYVILKTKISMRTGKDPVLEYIKSKDCVVKHTEVKKTKIKEKSKEKQSTFHSHVDLNGFSEATTLSVQNGAGHAAEVTVDNLISF